jgi:hypothetical protein
MTSPQIFMCFQQDRGNTPPPTIQQVVVRTSTMSSAKVSLCVGEGLERR